MSDLEPIAVNVAIAHSREVLKGIPCKLCGSTAKMRLTEWDTTREGLTFKVRARFQCKTCRNIDVGVVAWPMNAGQPAHTAQSAV